MTRTIAPKHANRKLIILNAKSCNKHLTDSWIATKSDEELLAFCHPLFRRFILGE